MNKTPDYGSGDSELESRVGLHVPIVQWTKWMGKDKNKIRLAQRRHRFEKKRKMIEYLSKHPCVDCCESDTRCLDFDHIRDKYKNVSVMLRSGYSWESVTEEMLKCVVRCANCHRKKTYDELVRRYSLTDKVQRS